MRAGARVMAKWFSAGLRTVPVQLYLRTLKAEKRVARAPDLQDAEAWGVRVGRLGRVCRTVRTRGLFEMRTRVSAKLTIVRLAYMLFR